MPTISSAGSPTLLIARRHETLEEDIARSVEWISLVVRSLTTHATTVIVEPYPISCAAASSALQALSVPSKPTTMRLG
jgi:hypothetical protein